MLTTFKVQYNAFNKKCKGYRYSAISKKEMDAIKNSK